VHPINEVHETFVRMIGELMALDPNSDLVFTGNSEPSLIAQALKTYGAVVIRKIMPQDVNEKIAGYLKNYLDADEAMIAANTVPIADRWYTKYGTKILGSLPEAQRNYILHALNQYQIKAVLESYFETDELFIEMHRMVFRGMKADIDYRHIPYHQDRGTHSNGVDGVINCWTPVTPCGGDYPKLEVVPCQNRRLLPVRPRPIIPENEQYDFIHLELDKIKDAFPDAVFWHPDLMPGDILMFSELVVHRTYVEPTMSKERISIEGRVTAKTALTMPPQSIPTLAPLAAFA
jgi:hypothetical protein